MEKFKLSVNEYKNILKSIQLQEISLKSLNANKSEEFIDNKLELSYKEHARHISDEKYIVFDYKFSLVAKSSVKEKAAIKIVVEFAIKYSNPENINIDPEFYEIFPNASLKYMVWPYFREIVQSIISRMNLPPLTLPAIMS
ncbi:MAG TPA: protein-export chaperone SecB [Candidatus Marinimicrobia bacterium]|nr:protein-export chaperone SecB [Candidatus Neomarinimicrobiota bacterium]HRS51952.1 protein-export chaperone SecB [Candidatus Neomarinimicrobiota bacterium]HRU91919.1 protein-export chaperone SecB [Candidatus Neomarinimicrobiota bacterium]